MVFCIILCFTNTKFTKKLYPLVEFKLRSSDLQASVANHLTTATNTHLLFKFSFSKFCKKSPFFIKSMNEFEYMLGTYWVQFHLLGDWKKYFGVV